MTTPQFIRLPPFLIEQLSKGRVVPFIGAGLSINAGLPDWRGLLEELAKVKNPSLPPTLATKIGTAISSGQYELAADSLAKALGSELVPALIRILENASHGPTDVHRLLASVRWPAVVTTNYDPLLSEAFPLAFERLTLRDDATIEQVLRSGAPHLIHAHGTLVCPESIVLTPAHYRECLRRPGYRTYLKVIFTRYTVVFLGFSFSDRDVNWLLEDLRHEFGPSESAHYALVPDSPELELRSSFLRQNHNVEVIPYLSSPSHAEVGEFVRRITEHRQNATLGALPVEELKALESQRPSLSEGEYLCLYAATCKGLSQSGYHRTAWISLSREFHRTEKNLSVADQLGTALVLAELMIVDDAFEDAHRVLMPFSQLPLKNEADAKLIHEFARLWFKAAWECGYGDTPQRAQELAISADAPDEDILEMRADLALQQFLNGHEETQATI